MEYPHARLDGTPQYNHPSDEDVPDVRLWTQGFRAQGLGQQGSSPGTRLSCRSATGLKWGSTWRASKAFSS